MTAEEFENSKQFICDKVCNMSKKCKRHKCKEVCCPARKGPDPNGLHMCLLQCNKTLSCGIHKCADFCHQGQCKPCSVFSREPLFLWDAFIIVYIMVHKLFQLLSRQLREIFGTLQLIEVFLEINLRTCHCKFCKLAMKIAVRIVQQVLNANCFDETYWSSDFEEFERTNEGWVEKSLTDLVIFF